MKCSKCGKENKDTAKYCSGCGAPLEQPEHSGEEKKKASEKISGSQEQELLF